MGMSHGLSIIKNEHSQVLRKPITRKLQEVAESPGHIWPNDDIPNHLQEKKDLTWGMEGGPGGGGGGGRGE